MDSSPTFGGIFDVVARSARIEELDKEMAASGFWDNQDQAREVIAESNRLKGWVDPWKKLDAQSSDLVEMASLLETEPDDDLEAEWLSEIEEIERGIEALEVRTMLQGSDDHRGALLTIHPGAGGLESQDWAEMLTRMYTRWAERHGYTVNVLDMQPGDEAGDQERDTGDLGGRRVRLPEGGKRRTPACTHIALRRPVAAAYVLCERVRVSTGRRRDRDRNRRIGFTHRHIPGLRRGRAAREQDGLRDPDHSRSHGNRRLLPARAVSA